MQDVKLYAPARPGDAIPMPDRNNRLLPADGAALDLALPYYRRLFDDRDIVEVIKTTERPAGKRGQPNRK
jgi:hypothetical protein